MRVIRFPCAPAVSDPKRRRPDAPRARAELIRRGRIDADEGAEPGRGSGRGMERVKGIEPSS